MYSRLSPSASKIFSKLWFSIQVASGHELTAYETKDGELVAGTAFSDLNTCGLLRSSGNTMYIEWTTDTTQTSPGFQVIFLLQHIANVYLEVFF